MAINLTDYSRTAAQRGWGAGWPSCNGAKAAGTAIVTADLSGTRMSVHKRIARLVDLLIDTTERRGYRLIPGQCGGYNCRAIGGTNSPSNHSWGLAVDLNWLRNPMRRPLTTDIPAWMVALWNRYGFAWGGHYSGTPDSMHFEFMGTPADADAMTALAIQELTDSAAPKPAVVTATPRGLFMHLTEAEEKTILEAAQSALFGKASVRSAGQMALAISTIGDHVTALRTELKALAARPAPGPGQVDPATIVAAVVDAIADAGLAQHVVDALAARLARPPAA